MKKFIIAFIWCIILCYVFMFFGGTLIFGSFHAITIFAAFILAVLGTVISRQSDEITALEKRITLLENKQETVQEQINHDK